MPPNAAVQPGFQFDRIAATLAGLVVIGLAVFLLIRNEPISDPRLFFVLRVVVSFSVATLGATIPGFLQLDWKGKGLAIRAGGALALFVLTYVYTPDLVSDRQAPATSSQTVIAKPGSVAAGRDITGNTITLGGAPPSTNPLAPATPVARTTPP